MVKYIILILLAGIFYACQDVKEEDINQRFLCEASFNVDNSFNQAKISYNEIVLNFNDPRWVPRSYKPDNSIYLTNGANWTTGFFPGVLWYIYEYTKDIYWLDEAKKWTEIKKSLSKYKGTHDLGFIMYCSYGNGVRLTNNNNYKNILIETAYSLSSRYDEKLKAIKSHDFDGYDYPVIIDNMMNLELLFWAFNTTNDSSFFNIAINHAITTLKSHRRKNNSFYQYVDFNSETSEIIKKGNTQGYNDETVWTRGQAWALYGFTFCYRETRDPLFLNVAEETADYIINHKNVQIYTIPFYDLEDPSIPNTYFDASSAAIFASALLDLYQFTNDVNRIKYKQAIENFLNCLSSDYFFSNGDDNYLFLIKHNIGSLPHNHEIDVPIIYADYYYLEALLKYKKLFLKE